MRKFVEPEMKVMAVNMKENIACSICNDSDCIDKNRTLQVRIGKNFGKSDQYNVHVKSYNNMIFNTGVIYNQNIKSYNIDYSCNV